MPANGLRVNHYDFVALHSMWIIFLKGYCIHNNPSEKLSSSSIYVTLKLFLEVIFEFWKPFFKQVAQKYELKT